MPRAASAKVVVITRVVGELKDWIVTSREVRINRFIEQLLLASPLSSEETKTEGLNVLTGLESNFSVEVSRVLDEWAVYREAKSLSATPAARGNLSELVAKAQALLETQSEWQALEPSPQEIRETVNRKLIVREFLRLKSDTSLVPVTDTDALNYFKRNRLRFGSLPFSDFKDSIKSFLIKQHIEKRLNEWREVLRRKYEVRNFILG